MRSLVSTSFILNYEMNEKTEIISVNSKNRLQLQMFTVVLCPLKVKLHINERFHIDCL